MLVTTETTSSTDYLALAETLGARFGERAGAHDAAGTFVEANYLALKEHRFFSAGVPTELGGGGLSHAELCEVIRILGRHCGSTALAFSMHTHLVAAAVWRYCHGKPAEKLLRRVAAEELVLVSTGAADWLGSNGTLERVDAQEVRVPLPERLEAVLAELVRRHPELERSLFRQAADGTRHLLPAVWRRGVRLRLDDPVAPDDVLDLVQAIAGG